MEMPEDASKEKMEAVTSTLSSADKYFIEQRDLLLQDINSTMDSILNSLNTVNISLESSIAVGKEFESVSDLWKTFYNGLESSNDIPPSSQDNGHDERDTNITNERVNN